MMPCDAAAAMYSKCIVSPLIRQPRQITASNRPVSASVQRGHRNLEGAGHVDERDVLVVDAGLQQRRARPSAGRP